MIRIIDRRAAYYRRAADIIAADPLDFYTRAEKGRRFQARFVVVVAPAAPAVKSTNVLRLPLGRRK